MDQILPPRRFLVFGTDASGDVEAFATDNAEVANSIREQMEGDLAGVTLVDTAALTATANLVHRIRRPSENDD